MNRLVIYKVLILLFAFVSYGRVYGQDKAASEKKVPSNEAAPQRGGSDVTGSIGNDPLQSSSTFDKTVVINEVKAQLADLSSKLLKELMEYCAKNNIVGEFVVDLTLEGKGKVLTVFMVSGGDDVVKKNLLKNRLIELKFENIKIPKKERVKLRYTLNF